MIYIIITTYNRPVMLKTLLNQIEEQIGHLDYSINIYNDGSTKSYKGINVRYKFKKNNGKNEYWKVVSKAFSDVEETKCNYYFMMPDDIVLRNDFFYHAIETWRAIKETNKICLNLLADNRVKNWTNFVRQDKGNYYLSQWVDMCFICEKRFFELLRYKISPIIIDRKRNPLMGSLVGQYISNRFVNMKLNMYQVKEKIVIHGKHKSMMNTRERKLHPL